jgi:ketosteroid isomerase-like protein
MKRFSIIVPLVIGAIFIAACGGGTTSTNTANNAPNANAAKPVAAAAPTAEQLLEQDRKANEAYFKGDAKFFESWLSDKFVGYDRGQREDKAAAIKMISGVKCDIKEGWKLEEPKLAKIDADTYVLTYKGRFDGTCTMGGRTEKALSPVRAATVVVRSGNEWKAVFHGENVIIDPKNPPAPEPKTEAKKEEPKKEDAKKEETAASNSNTAAPVKPAASANTDALVKIHTSGWEAFKAKDAKKLEEIATADLSFVDPIGGFTVGKSNVVKLWTETMKCEGITKVGVSDGFSSSVSPTLEVLTLKGTADGTCDGQKNGSLYQTAFYVKEGDAWKLAFMFETAAM